MFVMTEKGEAVNLAQVKHLAVWEIAQPDDKRVYRVRAGIGHKYVDMFTFDKRIDAHDYIVNLTTRYND